MPPAIKKCRYLVSGPKKPILFRIILMTCLVTPTLGCATYSLETSIAPNTDLTKVRKIGVLELRCDISSIGAAIADSLAVGLLDSDLVLVERPQLEKILWELGFEQTDFIGLDELKKIGELSGVDTLVIGSAMTSMYSGYEDVPTSVSIRLTDVQTGNVILGVYYTNPLGSFRKFIQRPSATDVGTYLAKEVIRHLSAK